MAVDAHQVYELAIDLHGAPARFEHDAKRTMKRSALEVKRKMQKDFSGHNYAGAVPGSLEFQQIDGAGLAYEIGELDSGGPQWGIAAILAYGTSNNAPVVNHASALLREAPAIIRHLLDDAADDVLGGP